MSKLVSTNTRFVSSLVETIAWCRARVNVADPKYSLRSKELKPTSRISFDASGDDFWNSQNLIEQVITLRRTHANVPLTVDAPPLSVDLEGGKLLLCFYKINNHNGAAQEASRGFFDHYDNPPWDTWIANHQDCLVSWVPADYLTIAEAGRYIECMHMLMWLDKPVLHSVSEEEINDVISALGIQLG